MRTNNHLGLNMSLMVSLLVGGVRLPAQPAVTFSVYPVPGLFGAPPGIIAGPDGALWFTTTGSSIWRSTTGGVMTEYRLPDDGIYYSAGKGAFYITVGPDGALWFTDVSAK